MEEWIRCVSSFEESEKIWSELTKTRPCPLKCNTRADVLFEEIKEYIESKNREGQTGNEELKGLREKIKDLNKILHDLILSHSQVKS